MQTETTTARPPTIAQVIVAISILSELTSDALDALFGVAVSVGVLVEAADAPVGIGGLGFDELIVTVVVCVFVGDISTLPGVISLSVFFLVVVGS